MGVKISALPPVGTPALTDIFPEVQPAVGGTTYQATFNQLLTLYKANIVTPANGGILYTDATQVQLLAPTATAHQVLLSGASSAPTWSTATYPVTTTINQLLYSSSANTIAGLATGNNGTLITSAGGVPSISSTLPSAVQGNITTLGAQAAALNMNSHQINNVTDPVSAQDAATKNYVDQTALTGTSVYAASTGSLGTVTQSGAGVGATLTNAGVQATFALDGVNPPVGSNVLIKDTSTGATAANEGIYTVTNAGSGASNWVLTRATFYDTPTEINRTGLIVVQNGSTLSGTAWINTTNIVTVDTTSFSYTRFGSAGTVTVANGGTGQTSLTAHNVLLGEGTSPVGFVAPSATSGVPLVSTGASADPAFGTAVVAGGGTGLTSTTAYAVLCGGTTSTGNLQSIASVGTANQVLTSNGAGALPTFQAVQRASVVGFVAYPSVSLSNVTGDGTAYSTIYDTTTLNTGTCYNTATGVFTVPTTGLWNLNAFIQASGFGAAHTTFSMYFYRTSGTPAYISYFIDVNPYAMLSIGNSDLRLNGSANLMLTAGDTIVLFVACSASTKTISIGGGINNSNFSAYLIG